MEDLTPRTTRTRVLDLRCKTCGCYLPDDKFLKNLTDKEKGEYIRSIKPKETYDICCKTEVMTQWDIFEMLNIENNR